VRRSPSASIPQRVHDLARQIHLFRSIVLSAFFSCRIPVQNSLVRPALPAAKPEWYDWTGPYVGINAGGTLGVGRQPPPSSLTGHFDLRGGLVGGSAGYNVQLGSTVFGLEGDIDWVNSRGSIACHAGAIVCSTASDYLATGRPLVGFTFQNNVVGYITGGAAFGNINQSFSPPLSGNSGTISNRVGWTAGTGVRYAFWTPWSSNWSIKFEYLYVDLGSFDCTVACSGIAGRITDIKLRENVFRTGINYRF
jgi:outer membrane immunogenic protein